MLPMCIAESPGIFQSKIFNSMSDLVCIWVYLDDMLVLTKDLFNKLIDKLQVVLKDQCKGKKLLHEYIEYLRYSLKYEGAKPLPQKIQAILDLQPPTTLSNYGQCSILCISIKEYGRREVKCLCP